MGRQLRSGNRRLIREINQALVLGIVRDHGPISRTDIAALAELSPATITAIAGALIEQGLIYEQEAGISTGGRPLHRTDHLALPEQTHDVRLGRCQRCRAPHRDRAAP